VGLVTAALCLPFIRTVYWIGDEGIWLHGAERLLRGDRLYVDFFEMLPPGSFVLTAVWFSIAGISFWSARLLAILTIVGIACFTYLTCRQVSKNALLSALLATGWVVMSQGMNTQVGHHWFTTLFSMVAAWATLASVEYPQRWLRWPLIAGAAAGMAAMITPTRGAFAMLAAVTAFLDLRRYRAELVVYVLGCALVPTGLLVYVATQHALVAAFDDIIRFTAERYVSTQGLPFGSFADPQNFLLKYIFPLAALLLLIVCVSDWRACRRDRLLRLCAAFGLAGFAACFPRADMDHIAVAAPLACPLLVCCFTRLTERWRPTYRYVVVAVAVGLGAPSARVFSWTAQKALHAEIVPTPRGGVAFMRTPGAREMLARIAATPSGDGYFFYPYMPILPFLAAREHVAKNDILLPEFNLPSQYHDACISVMRHVSWVVIDRKWTDPAVVNGAFPAMRDAKPQETKGLEQALESGFEFVAKEGELELRRRRVGISDALCTGTTG
jgi:hypothetical protein